MSSITNDKQSTFWSFSTFQPMLRLCQISEKNAQARMVLMPEVVLLVLESVVHVSNGNMTENFQSKSARTLHIYINISTA